MKLSGICCAALLIVCAAPAPAASVSTPESWASTSTAGWVAYDLVNEANRGAAYFGVEGGALRLRYMAQSMAMPADEVALKAGAGASGGAFVGNYLDAGVMAVSFRLKCELPMTARVLIQNDAARRRWVYDLGTVTTGAWQTLRVPVSAEALKVLNGSQDFSTYSADLQHVSWIGVLLVRNASAAQQQAWLDDFALEGAGPDFAAWMHGFAGGANWTAETLPEGDLDRDGANNYGEWVAGTDPDDPNATFRMRVEPEAGGGATLTWDATAGRFYQVYRADSAGGPYAALGAEVAATPPENAAVDASGGTAKFYRVKVRKP